MKQWQELAAKDDLLLELNTLADDLTLARGNDNLGEVERITEEINLCLKVAYRNNWVYSAEESLI